MEATLVPVEVRVLVLDDGCWMGPMLEGPRDLWGQGRCRRMEHEFFEEKLTG